MPLPSARLVGSTKASLSVSATAIPSTLLLIAVSMALAIWATLPFSDPVHCGSGRPSSAAASASPVLVGTKKEFVVTWLTNTNFHPGVLGNLPTPLALLLFWPSCTLVHAASRALAAPPMPRTFSADLRDVALSVIVDHFLWQEPDVWTNHSMIVLSSQEHRARYRDLFGQHACLAPLPALGEPVEVHRHPGTPGQLVRLEPDPEPRPARQRERTVHQFGQPRHAVLDVRIGEVVEILLNLEVDRGRGQVQVGRGGDRAAHVVRGHQQVVGLRGAGQLLGLQQTAGVGDVGLDDVRGLQLEQVAVVEPG